LTSAARRTVVVDASVVLKWQLDDETHVERAVALRDDHLLNGTIMAVAPTLLWYEVTNAIHDAARRKRLSSRVAENALAYLMACDVVLHVPAPPEILRLAGRMEISGYDAAYVELAERLRVELWTADGPLYRAANALGSVHWIGDYPLPE
jgi:predicted nucleic acid-binding protein